MRNLARSAVSAGVVGAVLAVGLLHCEGDDSSSAVQGFDGGSSGFEAAPSPDSAPPPFDAATDAADAGDAALPPTYDDAGCLVTSTVLPDPTAAGLPSAGLTLWLRADRGLSTGDGGTVCHWDDQSGHANSFLPATLTPPTSAPTGLKGKAAVSFVGNSYLVRGGVIGLPATSGRTVAVFGAVADLTSRFQYFTQGSIGSAGTFFGLDQNTFDSVGGREGAYVTNNAYDTSLATSGLPHSHVLSISSFVPGGTLPDVVEYSIDGVDTTLSRTPGGLGNGTVEDFSTANTTQIGSGNVTGALLGELVVWDHALSVTDRMAVEQYFKKRFP